MFSWLLSNRVSPDDIPDGYGSGTSDEMLIALFGILALFFFVLFIIFFIKYNILKEKYEELQIEEKQDKQSDE